MADGTTTELHHDSLVEETKSKDDEKKEKIQKLLEDALVATGLESLVISGEEGVQDSGLPGNEQSQGEVDTHSRDLSTTSAPHPLCKVPKTEWRDITEPLSLAVQHLTPGELVQEKHFSLFDAMSAVELMDPKMDAWMQWGGFVSYPRTVPEAIERGLLKMDGHTSAELVGIIDEVFACVATWLEGHTLAQTVFTCLYLLDTESIENIYLRAVSQAIVKIVEYMRECICRGGVYAEDDQQGVCFGFNMLNGLADSSVAASLKEAEEKATNFLKQSVANASENETKMTEPQADVHAEASKALLARIRFTRGLFAFINSLEKITAQGAESGLQKLSHCVGLLSEVTSTLDLGDKLDPDNPLVLGFHPVINQRLLPPSYKPYGIFPRAKGMKVLATVLNQFQKVFELGKLDTFRELFDAIVAFCTAPKSANVLVRSLVVLLCVQSDRKKCFGSPIMETLLREDARILCNPPSLNPRAPLSTSTQGKEAVDRFFGRVLTPMVEFLRVYCQHRARQRQRISRCLDMLGEFQQETERIDHLLHDLGMKLDTQRQHLACFGTWLLYYIVQQMLEYVTLGFEYNLYSPFELHYVYWYLEYLYGWQHTSLKSAEKLLMSEPVAAGKGKRKAKKKRELPREREREMAIIQAKRMTCVGIMRALEALIIDEKIPQPTFEFGSQELCYKHRFLPFATVSTPQWLSYADYIKLAGVENYKGRHMDLYDASARHFMSAKIAVESISHPTESLDSLLKAIKTNIVIMNLASRGHKKLSKLPPTLDFSAHKHFAIIRIN